MHFRMKEKIQQLHESALREVKIYLDSEANLIEILMELDELQGYRQYRAKCLSEYAMKVLKLPEDPANTLIGIGRKCVEVPKLLDLIREGSISTSNARLICPILTKENQEKWLTAAAHCSKRELSALIASENPDQAIKEKLNQVSQNLWKLELGLSKEHQEKLRRVQDLESSRLSKAATLVESTDAALECYLEKHDPLRKARRVWKRRLHLAEKLRLKQERDQAPIQAQAQNCTERESKSVQYGAPAKVY